MFPRKLIFNTTTTTPLFNLGRYYTATPHRMSATISAASKCEGCEGLTETLKATEVDNYMKMIPTWQLNETRTAITQYFRVKNFSTALDYINKVGEIAETENHHPDMTIRNYNHVYLELSTHSLGGLTTNDIIMAAKIDSITVDKRKPRDKK